MWTVPIACPSRLSACSIMIMSMSMDSLACKQAARFSLRPVAAVPVHCANGVCVALFSVQSRASSANECWPTVTRGF